MRGLNLFLFALFVFLNVFVSFLQRQGATVVTAYSTQDIILDEAAYSTEPLTLEVLTEVMLGRHEGVVVLDFHGSTGPRGEHIGIIEGQKFVFWEDEIPENVYISSCRAYRGVKNPPRYNWSGGVDLGSKGFIAPVGYILRPDASLDGFWSYRALRPYKVWWHLLTLPLLLLLVLLNREPILIGDVHACPMLVIKALLLSLLKQRRVLFAGDLLDGGSDAKPWHSALCVKLIRWCPWADTILGNHEVYPLWFGESPESLARAWREESCPNTTVRLWKEWKAIESLLTKGDLRWLRSRPLFVQGRGWTLVHAKIPAGGLMGISPYIGTKEPTLLQQEVFDGTKHWRKGGPRCFEKGLVYVGHTPRQKLPHHKWEWGNLLVLDWGAKKGETAAWVVAGKRNLKAL